MNAQDLELVFDVALSVVLLVLWLYAYKLYRSLEAAKKGRRTR